MERKTLQNNLLTSELPNNNINLGQELNDKENSLETVTQQQKVISFWIGFPSDELTYDSSVSKLSSQDIISPIPEVTPSNDSTNTTTTFM